MNETPKSKSGRRIPLALLIWLILFTLIVLVQTAGLVAYIVKHPHDEHIFPLRVFILRFFICGVVGATIPFCLWLFVHWLCCWRNLRRTLIGLAVLATLIAIFYAEEDWRGKRAWENCKRELEAKGMVLDWDKFIPPPVPDDQNFFTASSNILLRFHKAQTPEQSDAAAQLSWLRLPPLGSNSFPVFDTARTNPLVVAELTVLPPAGGTPEFVRTSFIAKLNDRRRARTGSRPARKNHWPEHPRRGGFSIFRISIEQPFPDADFFTGRHAAVGCRSGKPHFRGLHHQHRPFASRSHRRQGNFSGVADRRACYGGSRLFEMERPVCPGL